MPRRTLLLLLILGLILLALMARSAAFIWLSPPLIFYLAAGLLAAPGPARLRAARTLRHTRCETGSPVIMTITVQNDGQRIPLLRLADPLDPKIRLDDGEAFLSSDLAAGGQIVLTYRFHAPRGLYRWETVRVTASDPFALFETTLELPAPADLLVLPENTPPVPLRLRPRATLHAPGPNLSRLPGPGIDFYGVREYAPGDSLRWIHWRLAARHPGQFYSKEFEREETADIGLIVDGGPSAALSDGNTTLFEHSVQAAASLSRTLLRAGNRLSLLVLSSRLVRVFPGAGKAQLACILDRLAACQPGEKSGLATLKYLPVRLFPSRSLLILFSPLLRDDLPALARLRAQDYQVLLVSPNPVRFATASRLEPAVRAAALERSALLWQVRDLGVQVLDWDVRDPFHRAAASFHWT